MRYCFKKIHTVTLFLILFLLAGTLPVSAETAKPVYVLQIEGPIVPVIADYIQDGIAKAEKQNASCVIIELNTPGGLYTTTQKIVESILNSRTPVVVYVVPAGAWAASAGSFITLSAHVAAMAPGTRIGAAHPVTMGSNGEISDVQMEKASQDAAAWMRSLAQLKGRNPDAAQSMVIESKSFSNSEALEAGLIDLQAKNRDELVSLLHGQQVTLINNEKVTLEIKNKPVETLKMNPVQSLLFTVSEPNIAYILMTVGTLGLIVELYHPGTIFPGIVGGISLLLGLYTLGTLNAQFSGVLLLLLGLALLAAEIFVISGGLLAVGGIISFILGSLMLFSKGSPPFLQLSIPLVAGTALVMSGLVAILLRAVIKTHRRQAFTGRESLPGKTGLALTELKPNGTVLVDGERWRAESTEPIGTGEKVTVISVEGLKLKVKKWQDH